MLLYTKSRMNEEAVRLQLNQRDRERAMAEQTGAGAISQMIKSLPANMTVNAGRKPQDLYREFDNSIVQRIRQDDGDAFLNLLLPLAKAVNMGRLTYEYARASDAGRVRTSMSGQTGLVSDQVEYLPEGTIIPIHAAAFSRGFREWESGQAEGFDALIDDQRETVATVREAFADDFLDGHRDEDGNIIVYDGRSWGGMRNDSRVSQVTLTFDFTDTTKTYAEIEAAFKAQIRDVVWIDNKCNKELVYVVSLEVASNLERNSSESYNSVKIINRLAELFGVSRIVASNKLSGNQIMGFPLDGYVQPIAGMGLSTIAIPRTKWNDNYEFNVVHATGWNVKTDYSGNTCAIYAAS